MVTCPEGCEGDCDYCDVFLEEAEDDGQIEMDFDGGDDAEDKQ
jgi:hypothetical protein